LLCSGLIVIFIAFSLATFAEKEAWAQLFVQRPSTGPKPSANVPGHFLARVFLDEVPRTVNDQGRRDVAENRPQVRF
jgi:hypothetical protein